MTYNKVKHGLDKAGGIVAIILGSLICVDVLFSFITMLQTCTALAEAGVTNTGGLLFTTFIGLCLRLALGGIFISFGAQTMSVPFLYKDKITKKSYYVYSSKGKNITLIVFGGLLFLGGLLSGQLIDFLGGYGTSLDGILKIGQFIQNILAFSVMVLKIIAVALKGDIAVATTEQTAVSQTPVNAPSTVVDATSSTATVAPMSTPKVQQTSAPAEKKDGLESKIAELKHLKEVGVITEEEYKTAAERLISKEIEQ